MARKRHSKKRSHRRKRQSMSGVGASSMTGVLSMLTGAVVGKIAASKVLPNVDPKIKAFGQVGIGYGLNRFVKNPFIKGMGTGMIINGGLSALTSFGVISAISGIGAGVEVDYMSGDDDMMSGDDDMLGYDGSSDIQTIAGYSDEGIMSGGSSDISILAGLGADEDY
jgi:hypothetical protein